MEAAEPGETGEQEAAETPAQEAAEQPVQMIHGGGMVLVTEHHKNLFDHKNHHKKKHGY
jgi:hypothetical protein